MVVLKAMGQDAVLVNPFDANGLILFEGGVLSSMARHRQQSATAPEQGGVLLGYEGVLDFV